jgi:hypothetical protein
MKRILVLTLAFAVFLVAAAGPAAARAPARRHRLQGAALALGGVVILGGRLPRLPFIAGAPRWLWPYRARYYRYCRSLGAEDGDYAYDCRPYRYAEDPGAYQPRGYKVRVWIAGHNTPEGYQPGYWDVRRVGGPGPVQPHR